MPIAFPFRILQDHDKPKFGEPCNHCGLCCRVQACHVSRKFLNSQQAPCIALEMHDGKFMCGMVIRPSHYLNINWRDEAFEQELIQGFKRLIETGSGCGMDDICMAVKL